MSNKNMNSNADVTVNSLEKSTCFISFLTKVYDSTAYKVIYIISYGIATLLDLIRVAFFDASVDKAFFIIMMII